MNSFVYQNPTRLYYGSDQIEQNLANETAKYGKKVLLVYGGGSVKRNGLYDKVMQILQGSDCIVFEVAGVEPNPRLTTVTKGIEICKTEGVDLILAVGGGSVLDASKAIAAGAKYDGDVWNFYLRKDTIKDALPIGTILTLAATGSEMNSGGVITNWETKQKLSAGSPFTFPKFSFCDPANTYTVPADQTTYGIVDMMSHVFEQYFSHTKNAHLQQHLCEAVLKTVVEQAPNVIENPQSYEARETIMYCSTMALNGMISMGLLGDWACHAIEHEVSAIYDIPHGGGLAIIFPNWMKHVLDEGVDRFYDLATHVFNVDPVGKDKRSVAMEGIEKVRAFFDSIGAPSRLADYNIDETHITEMAEKSVSRGLIGNFKKLNQQDVETILRMSL